MLYNLLGLCQKAGKLVSGSDMVEDAVKTGKAQLVIITEDIGESMGKRFGDKTAFYNIETIVFGNKDDLGHSIGKSARSAVALTDKGLAQAFIKKYRTITNTPRGE